MNLVRRTPPAVADAKASNPSATAFSVAGPGISSLS